MSGEGGTIYVARSKKDGSIGCARPCSGCQRMLRARGVRAVYSVSDSEWGVIDV